MSKVTALYCRLSPRPDGSYEGVDVQEKWGRRYAEECWPSMRIEVFADRGISAANGDYRPEYERLREWITDGRVAHVWCVEQYRIERREIEWFEFAAKMDAAGIDELHTNRDGIIQVQDVTAGIRAVVGGGEARRLRRRTREMLAERAIEGRPPGGECWPYEHTIDDQGRKALRLIPERAEALRDAGDKILSGWSRSNVARHLNERGWRGARGAEWSYKTVDRALTNPTVAGLRTHRGRVVGRGNWEPVFDEGTWHAIRAKVTGPRTVEMANGKTYEVGQAHYGNRARRSFLLTGGVAVCGVCRSPMGAQVRKVKARSPAALYTCTGGYCTGITADPFEDHVRDVLLDELDTPEFLRALAEDDSSERREAINEQLTKVGSKRAGLSVMWSRDELTDDEWKAARDDLAAKESQLYADLAALPPPVKTVDITQVREAWPAMTLDERREIVTMFIASVVVHRAKPGTAKFDPDRVEVVWRRR